MGRGTVARYESFPYFGCTDTNPYLTQRLPEQGVLCDLLKKSFEDFVQSINSENFLNKSGVSSGDAAKAQSWMSSLEFKRIALSNEIQLQGGRAKYVNTHASFK